VRRLIVTLFASLLTLIAFANVASACGPLGYQPELPKALRK